MSESKTEDIEFEIVRILGNHDGRLTLGELMPILETWVDDRRWIGVAIDLHLVPDGKARYANCHVNHNHSGACVLEAVSSQ
jgi:hypothetical protein